MNYIKNVTFSILYIIGFILFLTFILTLFSYFNILSSKVVSIFKILIPIISLFIGGFYLGKRSNKKGWFEGLKLGLIFLILLVIFEFLALNINFEVKNILYYLIILASTSFGSIVGINKNIAQNK